MASKYGAYGSKSGGGKHEGQPTPKGKSVKSGSQLGSYGSKSGGGAYTSPGNSKKTMKGPGY